MKNRIDFFKKRIDEEQFNKWLDLIKNYATSKYDSKYDTYVVDYINTHNYTDDINAMFEYITNKYNYDIAINQLSKNLKYYMDLHNKNISDLSKDLNIPYSTVSDWCNARKYPRVDKLSLLANYFHINTYNLTEKQNTGVKIAVLGNIPARYTHRGYRGYNRL